MGLRGEGVSNNSGVVENGDFCSNFGRHFFGTFGDKDIVTIQRHEVLQ